MPEQISELTKVIGGQGGSNFFKLYVYNLTSWLVFLHSTILCWDQKNIPSYFVPKYGHLPCMCVLKNLSSSVFLAKLLFALVTFKPNWRYRGSWLYFFKGMLALCYLTVVIFCASHPLLWIKVWKDFNYNIACVMEEALWMKEKREVRAQVPLFSYHPTSWSQGEDGITGSTSGAGTTSAIKRVC